jgi:hypothetical protein
MSARGSSTKRRGGGGLKSGLSRNERNGPAGFTEPQDYVHCVHCRDNALSPPTDQGSISTRKGCEICWPEDENDRKAIRARPGMIYAPHRDPYRYKPDGSLLDRRDVSDLVKGRK